MSESMRYTEGTGLCKVQRDSSKALSFHLDIIPHGYAVLIMLNEMLL